jgi:hypothetical protein
MMKIRTVSVELNRKKTVDFQSWGNSVGLSADVWRRNRWTNRGMGGALTIM